MRHQHFEKLLTLQYPINDIFLRYKVKLTLTNNCCREILGTISNEFEHYPVSRLHIKLRKKLLISSLKCTFFPIEKKLRFLYVFFIYFNMADMR